MINILLSLMLSLAPTIFVKIHKTTDSPYVISASHLKPGEMCFTMRNPLNRAVKLHFVCFPDYPGVYVQFPANTTTAVDILSDTGEKLDCSYMGYDE